MLGKSAALDKTPLPEEKQGPTKRSKEIIEKVGENLI